jgi:hypothetical protein
MNLRDHWFARYAFALCKRIAERHAGGIWVESQPGPGFTFHFSLPETSSAKQN